MNIQNSPMERRVFLRGVLVATVLVPLGGSLASCVTGGGGTSTSPTGKVSGANPFGMADNSTIDAVIFKGGYGIDYVSFAGRLVQKNHPGTTAKVAPSTNIAQALQPRFVGGNPPDVIDNSGANLIGIKTILSQLEDLTPVINAKNLEGAIIKDTLYPGVLTPGTFEGKLAAINYVLTVYAVWYSDSLFQKNGWTVPKTWDEMFALGEKAKAQGKYLFCWGKEAATYFEEMAIASAIKEGGDEVRLALDNMKENCWSHPAMQSVLTGMEKIVKAGYVKPGGSGTPFTAAQAQWINAEEVLFYPSGSWIENEMKDQTKAGFKLTGAAVPTVTSGSKFPHEAMHSASLESFIVPSQAKNVAGGKELLRTMLSKDAATNFAKSKHSSTIVKGTIPADGFGSTALASQIKMLDEAGKNVFSWGFEKFYGINKDLLVVWNTFLAGKSDVATLTADMQEITDKVRNDSSVKKIEVK